MRKSFLRRLVRPILICAPILLSHTAQADSVATIESGPLQGVDIGRLTEYLGIPYAAPPLGDLRWKPPQAPQSWKTPRIADAFGSRCPQTTAVGEFSSPSSNEDCLFLNVFVPSMPAPGKKRAVMVWIPGGGFFAGGSNDYDPTSLVTNGDVIIVSINYRVGVLGFLSQPDLDSEGHVFANYGLLDQQFALQWVKKNIAAFGGDPTNVTIFGESAGAISVYAHLVSPGSKGLFEKAIIESGFTDYTELPEASPKSVITSSTAATSLGSQFAAAVGCFNDVAACLRKMPVQNIIDQQMPFISGLIVGAPPVPKSIDELLHNGNFNHVPVINGTNHDEWRWPLARTEQRTGKPLSAEQYLSELRKFFGDLTPKVATEYPLGKFGSPSEALAAAETDAYFSCGALRNSSWLAQYVPVYGYEFNDADAPIYMRPASFPYGAAHTKELQFIFPRFHGGSGTPHALTQSETELSLTMVRYWSNFAKYGDPNDSTLPFWPKFTLKEKSLASLNVPAPVSMLGDSFSADHKCAFWRSLLD